MDAAITIKGRYGTYHLPANDHQTVIWNASGHYEREYVDLLSNYVWNNYVAIDIGACFGAHAIAYAVTKRTRVWAFEPNPESRAYLQKSIEASGVEDLVTLLPYAIGSRVTRLGIPQGGHGNLGGAACKDLGDKNNVDVIPLDSMHFDRIDLIKIDVEGMEWDALQGMETTLRTHYPHLFVEVADPVTRPLIVEWLMFDIGYCSIFRHGKNIRCHVKVQAGAR